MNKDPDLDLHCPQRGQSVVHDGLMVNPSPSIPHFNNPGEDDFLKIVAKGENANAKFAQADMGRAFLLIVNFCMSKAMQCIKRGINTFAKSIDISACVIRSG